jgi:hypothetical protein
MGGFARSGGCFDLSNGRRIILARGLQIQSLGFVSSTPVAPTNFVLWSSANFSTFNSWNDDNSEKTLKWTMPWSRWIKTDGSNPLTSNEKNQHLSELVSLQYGDELNQDGTGTIDPTTSQQMADAYGSWRSQFGTNFLAYSNFGANNASKSMTPQGLANYMQYTEPDMLMFDAYPHQYVTISTWYAEMQKYRLAGMGGIDGTGRAPVPYAQYLDLYRGSYSASLPDEAFVRLQEFASWAFGYTFVTAFVYNKPNNSTVYPALFASDGDAQSTAVLGQIAEANRQSLNLGPALIRLASSDLRMIPGTGNSLPAGISSWSAGAGGTSYLTAIVPINGPGGNSSSSYSDVFIGYFEPLLANNVDYPYAQGTHFMLVNGSSSGTAAGKAQWYRLTFDLNGSIYDSVQVVSRDTGQIQQVPLTHLSGSLYSLEWELDGGTGDLFRLSSTQAGTPSSTFLFSPQPAASGGLIISGTNTTGLAGGTYSLLVSTNLAAPLANWTTNQIGVFSSNGSFSNVIDPNAMANQLFFTIKTP